MSEHSSSSPSPASQPRVSEENEVAVSEALIVAILRGYISATDGDEAKPEELEMVDVGMYEAEVQHIIDCIYEAVWPMLFALLGERDAFKAERDEVQRDLEISHENRVKESVQYANLCVEIIEATGYKGHGGGVTAIEAVRDLLSRCAALSAQVAALRDAVSDAIKMSGAVLSWLGSEFPNAEGTYDRFGGAIPARDDLRVLEVDLRAIEHYGKPLLRDTAAAARAHDAAIRQNALEGMAETLRLNEDTIAGFAHDKHKATQLIAFLLDRFALAAPAEGEEKKEGGATDGETA